MALLASAAIAVPVTGASAAESQRCNYLESWLAYPYHLKVPAATDGVTRVPCFLYQGMEDTGGSTIIRQLQRSLQLCNNQVLIIDGKYGSSTRAAVKAVQTSAGITADGVYGEQTRRAMAWPQYNPSDQWNGYCYRF